MNRKDNIFKVYQRLASVLLLVLYLFVSFYPTFHEEFSHDEENDQICTLEEDLNACHQATHHFESSTACEHPVHFEKSSHKCELCDYTATSLYVVDFNLFDLSSIYFVQSNDCFSNDNAVQPQLDSPPGRGPPSQIS